MTRLGKIARLPREIREQLNIRLHNGEEGVHLVEWLNALPEAQAVLVAKFGGRPINAQNLTEWKQGGFEDWLRHQDDCNHARMLVENAQELENEAGAIRLEDRLAAPVAIALAGLLREISGSSDDMEKQKIILGVARELAQLRRASHDAERARLERERWDTAQAEVNEKKREQAEFSAMFNARFPDFYTDSLRNPTGMQAQDIRACLDANARLQSAQTGLKESEPRTLNGTAST